MDWDFSKVWDVIDRVPEDFRGLYTEKDGKLVVDSEHAGVKSAVSAIMGLQKALVATRKENGELRGRADLSLLKDYGDNPAAILEAFIGKLKEAGKGKTHEDLDRQLAKIKEDLAKAHGTETEKHTKRIDALQKRLYKELVESRATSELATAGAIDPDLAIPHVVRQVRVSEEDGDYKVVVLDDAGDIRYSPTTGAPMSIKELVAGMKGSDKYGPLFKSEAPTGGGKPTGGPKPGTGYGKRSREDMTATEKIASGLGKGQYQRGKRAGNAGM